MRKKRGRSTDPSGAPFLIGKIWEDVLFTSAYCV